MKETRLAFVIATVVSSILEVKDSQSDVFRYHRSYVVERYRNRGIRSYACIVDVHTLSKISGLL